MSGLRIIALVLLTACDAGSPPVGSDGGEVIPGEDGSTPPVGGCGGGLLRCGEMCVDTSSDTGSCGACGRACGAGEVCASGRCGPPPDVCPPSGCPRGSYCDLGANRCVAGCLSDVECSAGRICEARSCVAGCRDDLGCGETQSCAGDVCTACAAMRGNCDRGAVDGCETDLARDPRHCGACGRACGAGNECVGGSCRCAGATTSCAGGCADTASDVAHCGGCGRSCPVPSHGAALCASGSCTARCDAGYHLCGATCAGNGAVATCGSSCTPCAPPAHATATCDGSSCGFTCEAGYVPCDAGCCRHCSATGCSGVTWCDETSGLCEPGCTRHDQCSGGFFCLLSSHECARTVDSSCPAGYTYRGRCSSGTSFCTHGGLPAGTTTVFVAPCPAGTTERGSYYCSDVTRVCVPDP